MTTRVYRVEFTATFTNDIEADSEEEARAILDKASIEDIYTDDSWCIDPYDFKKKIVSSCWDDESEDDDSKDDADKEIETSPYPVETWANFEEGAEAS